MKLISIINDRSRDQQYLVNLTYEEMEYLVDLQATHLGRAGDFDRTPAPYSEIDTSKKRAEHDRNRTIACAAVDAYETTAKLRELIFPPEPQQPTEP